MGDLEQAITKTQQAVEIAFGNDSDFPDKLSNFSNMFRSQQEITRIIQHSEQGAEKSWQEGEITSQDQSSLVSGLDNLLERQYEQSGTKQGQRQRSSTQNAHHQEVDWKVEVSSRNNSNCVRWYEMLHSMFQTQYRQTRRVRDLEQGIEKIQQAIASLPEDHPNFAPTQRILGEMRDFRHKLIEKMQDLDQAIEKVEQAVVNTLEDPLSFATLLNFQGNMFGRRYEESGSLQDLELSIKKLQQAVEITPKDNPAVAAPLDNLANMLSCRYEQTRVIQDLEQAIEKAQQAVEVTLKEHPMLASRLNNLSMKLERKYERTGRMQDLERAIEKSRQAVEITLEDHSSLAIWLYNLSSLFSIRYNLTGNMQDLEQAIGKAQQAMKITPEDHPPLADELHNLSNLLYLQYERTKRMQDLEQAIEKAQKAIKITPEDHPHLASRTTNLSILLQSRYMRTGSMQDLEQASGKAQQAVRIIPSGHSYLAMCFNNLSTMLVCRYKQTLSMQDLEQAIESTQQAVEITPEGHLELATYLDNLGCSLGLRYKRIGRIQDLEEAFEKAQQAVRITPKNHPELARRFWNLGDKYTYLSPMFSKDLALEFFLKSWNCQNGSSLIRLQSARMAAIILAMQSKWEESSNLWQGAVGLLPTVNSRFLEHSDKQFILKEFTNAASTAAATALNAGKDVHHALKLLELGRAVIAGLLLETRADVSVVREQYPELAEQFTSLRDELDLPISRASLPIPSAITPLDMQAKRRFEAEREFEEVIDRIRAKPGLYNFLHPPTEDELMAAAEEGPIVVINISFYRCDAFLIERHQVRLLELPIMNSQDIEEKVDYLKSNPSCLVTHSLLEWLWNVAAGPILEALGFTQAPSNDNLAHVWWIPTGKLSYLPIHAAGLHLKESNETVLDRVMSSYSSSVKALIYSRQRKIQMSVEDTSEGALLVAMPETPNKAPLPSASDEVAMLKSLCQSLNLMPVEPPSLKKEVLECLRTCKIFHFAGHGLSDSGEPSQSGLLLKDWKEDRLTVGDLRDYRLQENSPFLAYLSACSTGSNKAGKLIDEGIHLIGGCQLAGFRHVVGTLWEVSDKHCVDVARVFYQTLRDEGMTDLAVCKGLHRAIKALRDGHDEREKVVRDSDTARETSVQQITEEAAEGATRGTSRLWDDGNGSDAVNENSVQDLKTENDTRKAKRIANQASREDRDAVPLDDESCKKERERLLHWVPYVHYGV